MVSRADYQTDRDKTYTNT